MEMRLVRQLVDNACDSERTFCAATVDRDYLVDRIGIAEVFLRDFIGDDNGVRR